MDKTPHLASTFWLLLTAATLTVAVSTAAAAATRCPSGGCADDPAKISLTGIYLGQAVVALLAVMAVSGEYGTGMIRLTLAATPRRITVLAAKAGAAGFDLLLDQAGAGPRAADPPVPDQLRERRVVQVPGHRSVREPDRTPLAAARVPGSSFSRSK
jgi:hypothetical protein